jgi:hypothetical protein
VQGLVSYALANLTSMDRPHPWRMARRLLSCSRGAFCGSRIGTRLCFQPSLLPSLLFRATSTSNLGIAGSAFSNPRSVVGLSSFEQKGYENVFVELVCGRCPFRWLRRDSPRGGPIHPEP